MSAWRKDFIWTRRGVTVRETGAHVAFDRSLFKDLCIWFPYFWAEKIRSFFSQTFKAPTFTVSFTPRPARPWYLMRMVLLRAGARIVPPEALSDAAISFYDHTHVNLEPNPQARQNINFGCRDISKSHVAKVFESVFGYALAVDPQTYNGKMVRKSELNGAHDGSIIDGPCKPEPGWVYQRLIDALTPRGTVRDLRCPTVGGRVPLIYIKERPADLRFANMNATCELASPQDHFSDEDLALISQFCQKMKLDWGGLDILRDNETQRLYIVDVNKTDMGPPFALPMKDKLTSTTILAKALTQMIQGPSS